MDVNILIAVPCYGGLVQSRTMCALIELDRWLYGKKIEHTISTITNESLITRARNRFANIAAFDTDAEGRGYTHLLSIDADSVFQPADVLKMIEADKPVIGLPFALKEIKWELVAEAAKLGVPHDLLKYFAGNPNINTSKPIPVNEVMPIDQVGAGMMLINTNVFKALAEAHPERKYQLYENEIKPKSGRNYAYDFFRVGPGYSASIDPEIKYYLPEDFYFIEDARRLGIESYLLPNAVTGHVGSYEYAMNAPVVAASGLLGPRKIKFHDSAVNQAISVWKQTGCPKTLLNEEGNLDINNSRKISNYIVEHCDAKFTAENLDKAIEALRPVLSWYLTPQAQSQAA